jgi:hypothetical protein
MNDTFELENADILNQLQRVVANTGISQREYLALKSHKDSLEKENLELKEKNKILIEKLKFERERRNLTVYHNQYEENSKNYSKIAENINKLAEKPEDVKEYIRGLVGDIDRVIEILNEY